MGRVSYVQNDQAEPRIREMFEKTEKNGHTVVNLFRALAHAPKICEYFMKFGNKILFQGNISPQLRELAILAVSHATDAIYERTKHEAIALKEGVSQAQVDAMKQYQTAAVFDEQERAVIRYADEVSRNVRASDEAFEALRAHFNESGLVELTATVGFYNMVSRILENLQVDLEDDPTAV